MLKTNCGILKSISNLMNFQVHVESLQTAVERLWVDVCFDSEQCIEPFHHILFNCHKPAPQKAFRFVSFWATSVIIVGMSGHNTSQKD